MKQRGFTLLEILVALSIFTIIGLATTGLLSTVIDSSDASLERFEKLQQLQRAMITIERDVQQAMLRPVRIDGEQNDIVMRGGEIGDSDSGTIAFVRAGWHNPLNMLPRSTLQPVAYRLQDEKLERVFSHYPDNPIGSEPKVRTILDNVLDFKVEFVAPTQQANEDAEDLRWSENYSGSVLPRAVAITIVSADFGEIRREFSYAGLVQ